MEAMRGPIHLVFILSSVSCLLTPFFILLEAIAFHPPCLMSKIDGRRSMLLGRGRDATLPSLPGAGNGHDQTAECREVFEHGITKTWVLRPHRLTVKEGEFISIMGPSGAGKSTLLHILGMYDSGLDRRVFLYGCTGAQAQTQGARRTAQEKHRLRVPELSPVDNLTVYENLDLPLSYRNLAKKERESLVCDISTGSGSWAKKDLYPTQLSGVSSNWSRLPGRSSPVQR